MIKIEFQGHKGYQNIDESCVTFYECTFVNIIVAINILKDFNPGNYRFVIHQNQLALFNVERKRLLINDAWKKYKNIA
jgi:hypothetical protein